MDSYKTKDFNFNYLNKKIENNISSNINMKFVFNIIDLFYKNNDYINFLSLLKKIDIDFILNNPLFKYKLICSITACHLHNLENINLTIIESDNEYKNFLLDNVYENLLITDFSYYDESSIFIQNPLVSNILNMIDKLEYKINKMTITNNMSNVWKLEVFNILSSIKSIFILFNKSYFSQAMSVFRQALEQYITIKTVITYPHCIDSYLEHQAITIKDELHTLTNEELDNYIKEHGLTYNNYKSYLNYGWIDTIEEFKSLKEKKPNTKYGIKTVSIISSSDEFYEAMVFASNYVHSNFVFVNVNWNMVITEVIDGIYSMLDWLVSSYINIYDGDMIIDGINYLDMFNDIKNKNLNITKDENYNYYIKRTDEI